MNWLLLKNSLLVSGLTALLAASFGFLAALWLAGLERRWRHRLLAVAVVALALPPFLATNCWLHFLGSAGVWRGWLPLNIVSLGGTVWILSLLTWPITLLMVLSAWQRLEPSQLESDVAVSGWWLMRGLLWPLARTALAQAAVLTFVLALNNFAVPAILQVKVFPAEVWVLFNTTFDTVGALRLSWPLVVAPLLLLLWFARREFPWPRTEGPVRAKLFRQQLGPGWFWASGACTILLCLLAVGLPVFQLVSVKRTWTELPGALAAGQGALWNSFSLAAAAATLVVLFSLSTGFRTSGFGLPSAFGFRLSALGRWLAWLPFLLPGVLLGIGLIVLLNRPGFAFLYQSAAVVILAFVIRYLALGWNSLAHALRMVDRDLTDVARLDGASRWQMLRSVQWPQIAPQAAAAWYVVFLLCLWDVESMILVVPPGGETLALRVFNLLHYGHNAQVNALCLTLLGLAVTPLVIWKAWCVLRGACSVSTQHAKRTTILLASAVTLIAGCTPSAPSSQAPLASELFRRVQIIGSRGVGVGELNKPRSVAVDAQDNLYVADMTGRVQKFSSNGVFRLSWQMPQTALGKPKGMGRDRDGNIIVLEPHYQRVNVFSPEGKLVAQWGKRGTNAGELMMPRAVAVNSRREVFLSEYGLVERVQQFAPRTATVLSRSNSPVVGRASRLPNGSPALDSANAGETPEAAGETPAPLPEQLRSPSPQWLRSFGHPGNGPGEFNRPEGMCVDAQDRIYVADSCNHRIQVFSSDGKFIRAYGQAGKGKGDLSYPYDICVDAMGRQYVCEFGNSRIQVFDAHDQPLEIIGGPGAAPGQFANPWGVALDSAGNLYVADSQNHRVQKLLRQ
jgi:ABC-type Fe3+ transport system permease subunit/streptogramin lyase